MVREDVFVSFVDDGSELSRSDNTLVRSALRQDWPIPPAVKTQILQRLINYIDTDHVDGATAPDRLVISAAKTIVQFCQLGLEQQRLDLAERKIDGRSGGFSVVDLVGEAEQRAEQLERDRRAGTAG